MVCWNRTLRGDIDPNDPGLVELRKALLSSSAMSGDALSDLIKADYGVRKVEARISVNGHDVEVKNANGVWLVLEKPRLALTVGALPNSAHNDQTYGQPSIEHLAYTLRASSRNLAHEER